MIDANLIYSLGSGAVGILAGYFVPKIKISKKLEDSINTGFETVDTAIGVAKMTFPNNKYVNIADFIEKRAEKAVQLSEQTYHTGDIKTNEERFKIANNYVLNSLKIVGITPTESEREQIGNAIQAYVNQLGHKDKTDAEKEAEKNELQNKLNQATIENEQLKQKIATIQNTVSSSQAQNTPVTPQPVQK